MPSGRATSATSPQPKRNQNKHLHFSEAKSKENSAPLSSLCLLEKTNSGGCPSEGGVIGGQTGRKAADKGIPARSQTGDFRSSGLRRDSFHLQISAGMPRRTAITKRRSVFGNIELK
ncbi:hypothetical protein AVEN_58925-1 [Araneus ventricosus]|uniref:Uncharacterized protein n=1 Tax=Araneus ventricosus TaxID=182803 RepID=A0A4Y2ES41_ARAVE|nr:hypothetical protein AVEN_58925-1 [Araneus ventricosus]